MLLHVKKAKSFILNPFVKKVLLQNIKPKEAYAIYLLDNLSLLEILTLSDDWLTCGIESESLFKLYSVDPTNYNDITSLFIKTMHELNISELNQINASKEIVKVIFMKMINNEIDIRTASSEVSNIESSIEVDHSDTSIKKYFGSNLNLEAFLMWQRELSDCIDGSTLFYYSDLPNGEAYLKIEDELVSEAGKWIINNFTNQKLIVKKTQEPI